jgi:stage II sporulation protein M
MRPRPPAPAALYRRWIRLYVPIATLVLVGSVVAGFLLGSAVPVEALPTTENPGGNGIFPPLTTVDIAVNNLVAMTVILFGAVSLGLVSVFALVLNGLLVGAVVGIAIQQLSPLVVLALLVPHGILEIPALLVAAAIGLRFGRLTVRYIRGLEAALVTARDLREAGWLVAVCAALIVVAAYIEANLTIAIAEWVAGGDISEPGA